MKALFIMLCVFAGIALWQEEYAVMTLCFLGAWVLEGMINDVR